MSVVTISAIKADIGGYVGHSAVHPDLLAEAEARVREAVAEGLLIDGSVNSCGDDVNLLHAAQRALRARPAADGGHGVHDHAAGRRADA